MVERHLDRDVLHIHGGHSSNMAAGLVGGGLYVVLVAFRELGVVALLYSAGSEVVPVQLFDLYRNALLYEAALLGVMMAHVLLGVTVLMRRLAGAGRSSVV